MARYPKDKILFPDRALLRLSPGTLERIDGITGKEAKRGAVMRRIIEEWVDKQERARPVIQVQR